MPSSTAAAAGGTFGPWLPRLRSPGLMATDRDGNVRAAVTLMQRATSAGAGLAAATELEPLRCYFIAKLPRKR